MDNKQSNELDHSPKNFLVYLLAVLVLGILFFFLVYLPSSSNNSSTPQIVKKSIYGL